MSKREANMNDQQSAALVRSRAALPEEMQGLVDLETLNTDEFHYRFVQERPQNMARKRSKGYTPVVAEEEGVSTITGEVSADGLIRDGDAVLMKIPRERFEQGRKKLARLTEARLTAPVANFKKKTKGAGPEGKDIRVVDTDTED